MNQPSYVGIDVSAQTLEVASVGPGSSIQVSTFANTPTGHRQLLKRLTKQGRSARVCLEATGTYSLGVSLALHRQVRTEVMVVHP